nr:methyltransferase domain-containing protein [uncultured Niameybacter sp.]
MKEKAKMPNNIEFWGRMAKVYDLFMKKDAKAYEIMYDLIRSRLNPEMRVLELATGTGEIALHICQYVREVRATDYSEDMIHIAQKKSYSSSIYFEVMDACNLTYEENSFDIVIIANGLHVIPEPEIVIENIKKVLKKGGLIIAPTFTSISGSKNKLVRKFMERVGFRTYSKWDLEAYCNFLQENGIEIERRELIKATFDLMYVEGKFKENF